MKVELFVKGLVSIEIQSIIGIPDSTLKVFCDYVNSYNGEEFEHMVSANEGAAVGIAIGNYLATRKPACVYMQNSGIGNIVNPVTSIVNEEVYGIPMLFVIGWRGEPGIKDEPQHKFMGKITKEILDLLNIECSVIDKNTSQREYDEILKRVAEVLKQNKQYALIVKKNTFESKDNCKYNNIYNLKREDAIKEILKLLTERDLVVSTTGKISREVYEQSNSLWGNHSQDFLTVGGMGYASMIAYGVAKKERDKKIICIDGDGAMLMHMGNMAFIGSHPLKNMVHICLNNEAHESVGGMPTGAKSIKYSEIAKSCGYTQVFCIYNKEEIQDALKIVREQEGTFFIEIFVSLGSRSDLGRPKESARVNMEKFIEYRENL